MRCIFPNFGLLNNYTSSYLQINYKKVNYLFYPVNEPKLTFTNILIEIDEMGLLVIMDKKKPDSYSDPQKIIQNVKVNVHCDCCDNKKKSTRPSAFRAVNTTAEQSVTADTLVVPVLYPDKIFDLNNEYDPVTSTFTPKQDGVYSIIASVNFGPVVDGEIVPTNYRVLTVIRVNGNPVVADNDFFGEIPIGSGISVSAILQLATGDEVNVAAVSSTNGVLFANPLGMHFEAARLPSPVINDPSSNNSLTSSSNILSSGEL